MNDFSQKRLKTNAGSESRFGTTSKWWEFRIGQKGTDPTGSATLATAQHNASSAGWVPMSSSFLLETLFPLIADSLFLATYSNVLQTGSSTLTIAMLP